MRKLVYTLLTLVLVIGLESCSSSDDCSTTAYKIPTNATSLVQYKSQEVKTDNLTLTENLTVDGNLTVDNLELNGFSLIVKGDLKVKGNLILGLSVKAHKIKVKGNIDGVGTVTYCTELDVKGNTSEDATIVQDCGDTLSDNALDYPQVVVPCDWIGTVRDGYRYMSVE